MEFRVHTTQVRPRLTELFGRVLYRGEKVIILRHGKPIAALVSMADLNRIWEKEDDALYGPRDAISGRRRGPLTLASDVLKGVWNWPR